MCVKWYILVFVLVYVERGVLNEKKYIIMWYIFVYKEYYYRIFIVNFKFRWVGYEIFI